jgi:hypothetical protein
MKLEALLFMIMVYGLCLGGFLFCLFSSEKKRD